MSECTVIHFPGLSFHPVGMLQRNYYANIRLVALAQKPPKDLHYLAYSFPALVPLSVLEHKHTANEKTAPKTLDT